MRPSKSFSQLGPNSPNRDSQLGTKPFKPRLWGHLQFKPGQLLLGISTHPAIDSG